MKIKKLFICLCSFGVFMTMNAPIFGENNIEEEDTYTTSELITYETPEWTKRADIIGTVSRQITQPVLSTNVNFDYTTWKIGDSTVDCTANVSFYESFEKKYSGYKNIQFLAKTYQGHELITKIPSGKTKSVKYFFDYNEEAATYLPVMNTGYDENGQEMTLDSAVRNRENSVELQEFNYNATTDYEVANLSLQDLGFTSDVTIPYGSSSFVLDSNQQQPFVIATLNDQDKVTISYDRTMELPSAYFDDVKREVTNPSKNTKLTMQLGGTLTPIVRVKYAYDIYLKIKDLHSQEVNIGDSITFTSNVTTEFANDVAEDEQLPSSTTYYEVSSDEGKTWSKIDNSDDNDTLTLTATSEMNNNLYRFTAVADDSKHTTISSKPGKLTILNCTPEATENNDAEITSTPEQTIKEDEGIEIESPSIISEYPVEEKKTTGVDIPTIKDFIDYDLPKVADKLNQITQKEAKSTSNITNESNIVSTGDTTNIGILLSIVAITGTGITLLLIKFKKRKINN